MQKAKKPARLTPAQQERALKLWPAGPEREAMRELMKPLPTRAQIGAKIRAERKAAVMALTQAQRQAVLDDIHAGMKFGEIASKNATTVDVVGDIFIMNTKAHKYHVTSTVAK